MMILSWSTSAGSVPTTAIRRDSRYLRAPHFNYKVRDKKSGRDTVRQLWFDDPVSLAEKYSFAARLNLRGVGPYRWDQATGANAERMFAAIRENFVGEEAAKLRGGGLGGGNTASSTGAEEVLEEETVFT